MVSTGAFHQPRLLANLSHWVTVVWRPGMAECQSSLEATVIGSAISPLQHVEPVQELQGKRRF